MGSWDDLPPDLVGHILGFVCRHVDDRAARRVQRVWHGYRTRVLIGRFRMLRYLLVFRTFNPSIVTFLRRARL